MKRTKFAMFCLIIMICSVIMPYTVLGAVKPTVLLVTKDNYLGKILVEISNTNTSEIKKELSITSKNGENVDYQINYNADSQYWINIINPKLEESYAVNITERFNVPSKYNNKVFQWVISNQSFIKRETFPLKPSVGGDFKLAVFLTDSTTNQALTGVNPESVSIKAYNINDNSESNGTLLLKKVEVNSFPPAIIITANYNKRDFIDIEVTVNGVVLNQRKHTEIYSSDSVSEENKYPQWWLDGGGYSIPEKNSLTLSWIPAYDLNGITQYRVKANDNIVATITDDVYRDFSVTGVVYKYTLKGLDLNTKYVISVEAGNSLGLWSQDSQSFTYTTPSEDKTISTITQYGNVLGQFWATVYGVAEAEMQRGLKIYYEQDGEKKYVDFTIRENDRVNAQFMLEINNAKIQKEYHLEAQLPIKIREGTKDTLKWNLSTEKSKVYQEATPLQPKVNQDFTFVVFLHDGGEGHSVWNVKTNNFRIIPLKHGTNEKAKGQLTLKQAVIQDNKDNVTQGEASKYNITASYSDIENIDIQVAIDDVILNDMLYNVNVERDNQQSSNDSPNSGSGGVATSNPVVTTPPTEKPAIKNVFTKNVDTVKVINALKEKLLATKESSVFAFTDTTTHWGSQNVNVFVKLGVISGYDDGTFHPDAKITRAEFATIISKIFNIENGSKTLSLSDVKGHWANDAIQSLASHGIINGYEDGSFKPDNTISRAEIIAILARVIDLSTAQKSSNASFGDITGSWNGGEIKEAAEVGLVEGRDATTFAPNESSTRVESLTIILRALKLNPEIKSILDQIK